MANYNTLKSAIEQVIKTNGNEEITGALLQQALIAMINSLGAGYQFVGVAVPETNPGTPDYNVFYFAGPGTYPNFNNATIPARNVGLLSYNGTWHVSSIQTTPFSAESIVNDIIQLYDGATPVYPRTRAEAVFFNNDTTKTLDQKFGQLSQDVNDVRNSLGMSVEEDFVNSSAHQNEDIVFPISLNDKVEIVLTNIGEVTSPTYLYGIKPDSSVTSVLKSFSLAAGSSETYILDRYTEYSGLRFGLAGSGGSFHVKITKVTGLTQVVESNTNNILNIDNKVGLPVVENVDFSLKAYEDIKYVAKAGDTIVIYAKNVGANTATVSLNMLNSDGTTTGVFKYLSAAPGDSDSFEKTLAKDVVGLQVSIGSARTIWDFGISNKDGISQQVENLQETVDKKADVSIGKNLFYKSAENDNQYINSAGTPSEHASFYISNKIKVNGHSSLIAKNIDTQSNCYCVVCASDGTKLAVIQQSSIVPAGLTGENIYGVLDLTSYPTADYVIFSFGKGSWRDMLEPIIVYGDNDISYYEPYSEIEGKQIEWYEVTCNSDDNADADYTGNTAIREAIAAIKDKCDYFHRYVLKCSGQFKAELPSQYEIDPFGGVQYALFWLRNYMYLDGGDKDNCMLYASLPDTLAECQADTPAFVYNDYNLYQPLLINHFTTKIKNITMVVRNGRYPLHGDQPNVFAKIDREILVENCSLINEGKHGDSVGTSSESASGFGLGGDYVVRFKNCLFKALAPAGLYFHDNVNYVGKTTYIFEDCMVSWIGQTAINTGFQMIMENNPRGNTVYMKNVKLPKTAFLNPSVHITESVKGRFEWADINHTELISDGDALPIYNTMNGLGIRVEKNSAGTGTIRFVPSSSAFDSIIGDSENSLFIESNQYLRTEQYRYQWRDGANGLKAEAIGLRNCSTSIFSIGVRLGDCSGTNKVLGIVIDGVTYNVTFDKDYTSMSNDAIIAEINAIIGSVATASLFDVNSDWYPLFDGEEYAVVDDATSILKGMGVVYTENGVRKAKSTDGYIDGIAVDSGANGASIRIITKGRLGFDPTNDLSSLHAYINTNKTYDQVPFRTLFGIGENDGIFIEGATHGTLKKSNLYSVEIV